MGSRLGKKTIDIELMKRSLIKNNWNYTLVAMETGYTAAYITRWVEKHIYQLTDKPELENCLRFRLLMMINHPDEKIALKGMNMYAKLASALSPDVKKSETDDESDFEITF